jgi:hypothetical protein
VLIPCLQEFGSVLFDKPFDFAQLSPVESVVGCQCDWIEPELGLIFADLDVDVRRFLAFIAIEKEPETPDP